MSFIDKYYKKFNDSVGERSLIVSRIEFANLLGVFSKQEQLLKLKEEECEFSNLRIIQLQETLSQYETDLSIKDCIVETCKAQYKELKAENEELKKELQAQRAFTRHEQKLIYCVAYDETCKTGNDCKQKKCIFKDNIKLKQTLTEIKEILEIHKDNKCAICPKFDECFEHPSCDNIILQKISEVIKDE